MEEGYEIFTFAFGVHNQGTLTVKCLLKQASKPIQIGFVAITDAISLPISQESVFEQFRGVEITPSNGNSIRVMISWIEHEQLLVQIAQNERVVMSELVSARQVYPAVSYSYEPYQTIQLEVMKMESTSVETIAQWSNQLSDIDDLDWQTTFVNGIQQSSLDGSYIATDGNRLMSTRYGYSFGEAEIVISTGKTGLGGIGVCCRPGMVLW